MLLWGVSESAHFLRNKVGAWAALFGVKHFLGGLYSGLLLAVACCCELYLLLGRRKVRYQVHRAVLQLLRPLPANFMRLLLLPDTVLDIGLNTS